MPALLQSAHIGNPVLSARITAAVIWFCPRWTVLLH